MAKLKSNQKEFIALDGKSIILDTSKEACEKLGAKPGDTLVGVCGKEGEVMGVALARDCEGEGDAIWCMVDGRVGFFEVGKVNRAILKSEKK